jgi:hypothetical protein
MGKTLYSGAKSPRRKKHPHAYGEDAFVKSK